MRVLILTHGTFGQELLTAAHTIAGELPGFEALCLDWDDTPEVADAKLARALETRAPGGQESGEEPVLILTDLFGSTPTNAALRCLDPGRIEVITGVNLPMVVRLGCSHRPDSDLGALAHWLQKKSRDAVCVGSDCKRTPSVSRNLRPRGACGETTQ